MEKVKLFVYGTLKNGFANNGRFMVSARCLGDAQIHDYALYLCGNVLPMIVNELGRTVHGELWELNETQLKHLDRLEIAYERRILTVRHKGQLYEAFAYCARLSAEEHIRKYDRLVPDGVYRGWKEHLLD